jgi:hypothetical protein
MEKAISTVPYIFLFATIICIAYISPSQKVENAEGKVLDTKKEVKKAKQNLSFILQSFVTEYQQFRIVNDNTIITNEKSIAELKLNISSANKENKVIYKKKLAELERRNNDLKIEQAD